MRFSRTHSIGKLWAPPADTREPCLAPPLPGHQRHKMLTTNGAGEEKSQEEAKKSSDSKAGARCGSSPAPEISWFDIRTGRVPLASFGKQLHPDGSVGPSAPHLLLSISSAACKGFTGRFSHWLLKVPLEWLEGTTPELLSHPMQSCPTEPRFHSHHKYRRAPPPMLAHQVGRGKIPRRGFLRAKEGKD